MFGGLTGGVGGNIDIMSTIINNSSTGDNICIGGGGGWGQNIGNCCEQGGSGANGSPGLLIVSW